MDYIEEDYKKLALQFAKLFSDCTPAECKEALHNMFLGFIGSQFCGEIPDRTREYTTICYFELTKCFDAIEKLHINISTQQKLVQWLINNNQLDVFSQYIKDKKWLLN
ncbi:MAG: hypothetical protein IPG89_05810 [Bacteroidetes bacterium]|nr:hypothetical protein [Bacteroidota bacterium]